ncbi:MAG: glycoside hydrolase family 13 protein [Ruminococcaceae bacterium]|nr:glycoside hydrolase family 13 protein [Oscillospiraceae bacterium]
MKVYKSFTEIENVGEMQIFSELLGKQVYGAVKYGDVLLFKIIVNSRLLCKNVELEFFEEEFDKTFIVNTKRQNNTFTARVNTRDICKHNDGLLFLSIKLGTIYGQLYMIYKNNGFLLTENAAGEEKLQLTVYAADYETPEFIKGGIIYQIMVDRFCIGGKRIYKIGTVNLENWNTPIPQYAKFPGDHVENNCFYGGNLLGVTSKIPYLKSLGVTCIYLCPIFEAYSNHKYDTGDYMKVDEAFGGDAALEMLIKTARENGIFVVLDGVFNHTGIDSVYFNAKNNYPSLGAFNSKDSPYYDWYTFTEFPHEYKCWWGIKILPTVKTSNKNYINFISGKNGVVRKYMDMGIKGFRLDVADELSDNFLEVFRKSVKEYDANAVIWGEVWEDASNKIAYDKRRKYFRGKQLDGVMNYPLREAVINFLLYSNPHELADVCRTLWYNYPEFVSHSLMNFLGTHDTPRIITVLSGVDISKMDNRQISLFRLSDKQIDEAKELLKLGLVLIMTLPGIPCVYYGDEAGVQGGSDPFNRTTYPWGKEDEELLSYVRLLSKIRQNNKDVFKDGGFKIIDCKNGVFTFLRDKDSKKMLICVNRSDYVYDLYFGHVGVDQISFQSHNGFAPVQSKKAVIISYTSN